MKIAFVLPSCNYNICLSREELKQLIDKGYVTTTFRPSRVPGCFVGMGGVKQKNVYHELDYTDKNGKYPVQFLGVCLEKEESNNGES